MNRGGGRRGLRQSADVRERAALKSTLKHFKHCVKQQMRATVVHCAAQFALLRQSTHRVLCNELVGGKPERQQKVRTGGGITRHVIRG